MSQQMAARVASWSRLAAFAATLAIGPAALAGPIALNTRRQFSVNQLGFEVFDFTKSLGITSTPGKGASCGDDPIPGLATPGIRHAKFRLASVNDSITVIGTAVAPGGGSRYLMAASAPEPGTWLFVGLGLALIALGWTRSHPRHRN
jgi:hypothetical protein